MPRVAIDVDMSESRRKMASMDITLTVTECATCGQTTRCATHPDLHGSICAECWTAEVAYMRAQLADDEIDIDHAITDAFRR